MPSATNPLYSNRYIRGYVLIYRHIHVCVHTCVLLSVCVCVCVCGGLALQMLRYLYRTILMSYLINALTGLLMNHVLVTYILPRSYDIFIRGQEICSGAQRCHDTVHTHTHTHTHVTSYTSHDSMLQYIHYIRFFYGLSHYITPHHTTPHHITSHHIISLINVHVLLGNVRGTHPEQRHGAWTLEILCGLLQTRYLSPCRGGHWAGEGCLPLFRYWSEYVCYVTYSFCCFQSSFFRTPQHPSP